MMEDEPPAAPVKFRMADLPEHATPGEVFDAIGAAMGWTPDQIAQVLSIFSHSRDIWITYQQHQHKKRGTEPQNSSTQ